MKNRGYGSVSVCGGIASGIKTPLIRLNGRLDSDQYIQQVLQPHAIPFINNPNNYVNILAQDNATTMLYLIGLTLPIFFLRNNLRGNLNVAIDATRYESSPTH